MPKSHTIFYTRSTKPQVCVVVIGLGRRREKERYPLNDSQGRKIQNLFREISNLLCRKFLISSTYLCWGIVQLFYIELCSEQLCSWPATNSRFTYRPVYISKYNLFVESLVMSTGIFPLLHTQTHIYISPAQFLLTSRNASCQTQDKEILPR